MSDELGGFENVREEVEGHPMVGLLGFARPYWRRLAVGVTASLTTRLARLVPPLVVAAAIDRVILRSGEPGLLAEFGLVTTASLGTDAARVGLLRRLALVAALAYVVRSVTRFVSRYLLQSTAQKIQRDLRNDTYDHMQHLSLDFFSDHQTGAMMSILNNDINRLERFLNDELRQILRVVATVGGIGLVLFYVSPPLAVIALAPVPIIGVSSAYFLTWIEPKYKRIRETVARLNARLENNIGGAKVIKAFDRYDFELDRVAEQSETYHDEKVAAIRLRRAFFAIIRVLTGVAFVGLLLVGGEMVIRGRFELGPIAVAGAITTGTFTMFFLFLRRLYAPMRRIGVTVNRYQRAKSSAERVFGVLGHEPTITSPGDALDPGDVDGRVTFDDVGFSYDGSETVLSGVSLDVEPGETVGLVGETGAGKSTLVKLVPRFYDVDEQSSSRPSEAHSASEAVDGSQPSARQTESDGVNSGAVRVDGTDVREYDLQGLREHVGVVEQDPYLFSGTVAENIAYGDLTALDAGGEDDRRSSAGRAQSGASDERSESAVRRGAKRSDGVFRSGATGDSSREQGERDGVDDRIVEAAKAAEAHEFVSALPEGYDTQIGERGVKLSGGERQRLSIARALLNDPAIIVLDEATSDVDTETEELIQESLRRLTADRTAFVIAHRLSTVRDADRIVVMDGGEIAETGTHDELLEEGGIYADLWATQSDAGDSVTVTD